MQQYYLKPVMAEEPINMVVLRSWLRHNDIIGADYKVGIFISHPFWKDVQIRLIMSMNKPTVELQ